MRLLRSFLISIVISVISAFTVFAAQGTISFSDPEVTVGDEVNVTMKITADEGTELDSANIVLTYPASGLEFISGTDADGGAGAIRVHGTSNGKGTSKLEYNLKFKTSIAGSYSLTIDSYEVYDSSEQPIDFTHLGSSSVTVRAEADASANCSLSSLDVYPGELEPAFDPEQTSYSLKVGTGVKNITVNAITADAAANVRIDGNNGLGDGDSDIVITVNAPDGASSLEYVISVSKVEGGPEAEDGNIGLSDSVQLSSKGKTITIMNPGEDIEIPAGFKQGTISIDEKKVQGWVWGAAETPEYCVVYGMNDKGELNFYRYDMTEKTIQRYFEDPLSANSVSNAEYSALEAEKTAAERSAETRLIIIVVMAVIAFAAVMGCIYMWFRLKTSERLQRSYRRQNLERVRGTASSGDNDSSGTPETQESSLENVNEILKHDFTSDGASENVSEADETQVIRRPERKRRARRNRSLSPELSQENAEDSNADLSGGENIDPEELEIADEDAVIESAESGEFSDIDFFSEK
ncbi:MAG: cadherin-like beta sandwich domain-containing protein [Clostridiales bacterium]|nr:cadherin-like beta sandwich domain-containing protein [Clostridiales bacterium]